MQESRTSQIRTILDTILSDKQAHSFEELFGIIQSVDDSLLTSPNMLSSILSRLVKTDPRVVRPKRGYFQFVPIDGSYLLEYLTPEDEPGRADDTPAMSAEDPMSETAWQMSSEEADDISVSPARSPVPGESSVSYPLLFPNLPVTQLRQILDDIDRKLKTPDYEMEESEFRANKKLYLIKTHLKAILLLCSELS